MEGMEARPMAAPDMPQDAALMEDVTRRLHEACERVTHHRQEAERWERIARACGAAVNQLETHSPWLELSPGDVMAAHQPQSAVRGPVPG